MTDIVERLREGNGGFQELRDMCAEAANEIERLRKALKHYACACGNAYNCEVGNIHSPSCGYRAWKVLERNQK